VDVVIAVKLKKRRIADLKLPVPILVHRLMNGDREMEIVFDTDDKELVKKSMKIIRELLKDYRQTHTRRIDKEKYLKELGIRRKKPHPSHKD